MSKEKTPLKKVFTTYWVDEMVSPIGHKDEGVDEFYKDVSTNGLYQAKELVRPTNIPFRELEVFTRHKTRVTIEVIE